MTSPVRSFKIISLGNPKGTDLSELKTPGGDANVGDANVGDANVGDANVGAATVGAAPNGRNGTEFRWSNLSGSGAVSAITQRLPYRPYSDHGEDA